MTAEEVIALLKLEPLPGEGGYFRQTYRSQGTIPAEVIPIHQGERVFGTAIYYFITPNSHSALHRIRQDEIFHFYLGDAVVMNQLLPDGSQHKIILGNDLMAGQTLQLVVPGGVWQETRLLPGGKWALLGCTVSPGFEFTDFEMRKE